MPGTVNSRAKLAASPRCAAFNSPYQRMVSLTENTGSLLPCTTIILPPRFLKALRSLGLGGVMKAIGDCVKAPLVALTLPASVSKL